MEKLKNLYRFLSPKFQNVHLEYKVDARPRYGHGKPPHDSLNRIIDANRKNYHYLLCRFKEHGHFISEIKKSADEINPDLPTWNNDFLPGLDIIGIYGMLAEFKPARYIEVGSGNSTKVARKAINDHKLKTKITSIDPFPRANIDHLADEVIRKPFESLEDLSFITNGLEANDILFIDNSHRVLPNSDATIFFLETLPLLKKGVIVHIHDIYLPYDYPQFMCDRFYSEQYMLAAFILANPGKYETLLPNYFISEDAELSKTIAPIWQLENLKGVEKHGGSFWLVVK